MKWFFSPPFLSVSPFLLLNLVRRQCYAYAIGLYTRPEIKSWLDVKFCAHAQCVLLRCFFAVLFVAWKNFKWILEKCPIAGICYLTRAICVWLEEFGRWLSGFKRKLLLARIHFPEDLQFPQHRHFRLCVPWAFLRQLSGRLSSEPLLLDGLGLCFRSAFSSLCFTPEAFQLNRIWYELFVPFYRKKSLFLLVSNKQSDFFCVSRIHFKLALGKIQHWNYSIWIPWFPENCSAFT